MKVSIVICTHRYLEPYSVDCLIRTIMSSDQNIKYEYAFQMEAMIDRSRAIQATEFLESDADVLLFLDDDILYNLDSIPRIVKSAIGKQSVVCGPYAKKTEGGSIICVSLATEDIKLGKDGGLMEIRWGGTGFMAIPRIVFETLAKTTKKANIRDDLRVYPFFLPFIYDPDGENVYLTEDYAFCERAREAGFKIWMDTRCELGHIGAKIYVPGN